MRTICAQFFAFLFFVLFVDAFLINLYAHIMHKSLYIFYGCMCRVHLLAYLVAVLFFSMSDLIKIANPIKSFNALTIIGVGCLLFFGF